MVTENYGFKKEDIDESCPADLEPYINAYNLKQKKQDEQMWLQGKYNLCALETVMAHFGAGLSGKKSDAQYWEKPILQLIEDESHEKTEEEINREIQKAILNEIAWNNMLQAKGLPTAKK